MGPPAGRHGYPALFGVAYGLRVLGVGIWASGALGLFGNVSKAAQYNLQKGPGSQYSRTGGIWVMVTVRCNVI